MEWITSTSGAGVRDTGWLQGAYPTLNTDTLPRSGFVQSILLPAGNRIDTTALYTRVATNTIREVVSPLDRLTPLMPKKNEPKDGPPA
jgi:hypothetical protein